VQLGWTPGKTAVMHDVYFSTDQAAVAARDLSTFKGDFMIPSYDPGQLEWFTTYYWAVDQFSPTGTVAGPVWSFKTDTNLRINEILYWPEIESPDRPQYSVEWVEIVNVGEFSQNIGGWSISNRNGRANATLPSWDIPPDGYLTVYFGTGDGDNDFSDGAGCFYTGSDVEAFDNIEDECALYNGAPDSTTVMDFVSWCHDGDYSPGLAHDYAVSASIWDPGSFFETSKGNYFGGESIGRDHEATDDDIPMDWYGLGGVNAGGPTPSKDNEALNIYDRSIAGKVVDPEGNPVPAVKVRVHGTNNEVYTDSEGVYYVVNSPIGEVPVVYEKAGYVVNTRIVPVSNHSRSFYNVVLVPHAVANAVGPSGAILHVEGGITVNIPPGALDKTVDIAITALPAKAFPETLIDVSTIVLNAIALEPSGLEFAKPITVTIPPAYIQQENITETLADAMAKNGLRFSYFDPEELTWTVGGNAALDESTDNLTIELSHFSVIRTETYLWNWFIYLKDEGYIELDRKYEGNSYCGIPFTKTISKAVSVSLEGAVEVPYGPIGVKVGAEIMESGEFTGKYGPRASGPCEELEFYSTVRYKKWSGKAWKTGTKWVSKLVSGDGWIYDGPFRVLVPHGISVRFERREVLECCPEDVVKPTETSSYQIEDDSGSSVGETELLVGDSTSLQAVGYDAKGDPTGSKPVIWRSKGDLFPPISHIGVSYVFTPLEPGSGTITVDDASGHTASTGVITVAAQ
jgi:hypothetical protein